VELCLTWFLYTHLERIYYGTIGTSVAGIRHPSNVVHCKTWVIFSGVLSNMVTMFMDIISQALFNNQPYMIVRYPQNFEIWHQSRLQFRYLPPYLWSGHYIFCTHIDEDVYRLTDDEELFIIILFVVPHILQLGRCYETANIVTVRCVHWTVGKVTRYRRISAQNRAVCRKVVFINRPSHTS